MSPKLSSDVQQAVEQNHGFAQAEVDGEKFVVMSMDYYRELMGVGSEAELQNSLRAIDEGLADVDAGRTTPADQFFDDFDKRRTTMIYTHVLNRGGRGVRSPADVLARRSDDR